ncbi:MAG: HD domain-containing protein [Thermodesulfobacteriota bacterium]
MPSTLSRPFSPPDQREAQIKKRALAFFPQGRNSHDWEHTERVLALAVRIGESSDADLFVVRTAAILHDIARSIQDQSAGAICHAQKGAELAAGILTDLSIPNQSAENILHCIRTHRFRGTDIPQTVEAKTLFDADKLDSIGAIGIARAFQFAGEVGARLHNPRNDIENTSAYSREDTGYREYMVKLRHIPSRMQTEEGKRLAAKRAEFMHLFFQHFLAEHAAEM